MRQLRLAFALLLAFALPAEGLLSHAARAHHLAASAAEAGLCKSSTDQGTPAHLAACTDHCLGAAAGKGAPPAAIAAQVMSATAAARDIPAGPVLRASSRLTFDHAPRAPPAVA